MQGLCIWVPGSTSTNMGWEGSSRQGIQFKSKFKRKLGFFQWIWNSTAITCIAASSAWQGFNRNMRCRIKEVIISCHMVLIKPSLKCYALFIKNKEIKKNWGKRVRMILEPVTFGGDRAVGRAQAMELEPGYINSWLWLDIVDSNQASISIQGWWSTSLRSTDGVGWLACSPRFWSSGQITLWVGSFLLTSPIQGQSLMPPGKFLHSWNANVCILQYGSWKLYMAFQHLKYDWETEILIFFNFNEVKMESHMCKYTAQL